MLAALVQVQAEGEEDRKPGMGWKKWEWDMRMEWAPHVIPCIAMLYLMRNAGEPPSGESVEGNETTEFGGGGEWGGEWGGRSFSSSRPDGKEPSLTHYGLTGA